MNKSTKWALLLWLFVTIMLFAETIANHVLQSPVYFDLLWGVVGLPLLYLWIMEDAFENSLLLPSLFGVFVVILAGVAVPYYLLRYRGWRYTLSVIAKVFGALLVSGIAVVLLEDYILSRL